MVISGTMTMDPPAYTEQDLGTMTVRASGRVLARTWRTMEAETALTAPGKVYTGPPPTPTAAARGVRRCSRTAACGC